MDFQFELVDLLLVSPALALFFASIVPLTIKVFNNNKELNPFVTILWGFIGLVAAAMLAISNFGIEKMAFSDALVFDGMSSWSTLLVVMLTGFTLIISRENLATCTNQFSEYVFLILNSALGMLLLSWSNDLIVTFIAIEIMSLCLYILIAMSREEQLSKEAALKYFILGSFGSAVFLYGLAFFYGIAGTTYINELAKMASDLMETNRLFVVGAVLTMIGLCFKVGLAPFHAWSPDVYEGSPTPVTAFMATGVKVVTFAAFLRLVTTQILSPDSSYQLIVFLQWIAVGSMLLGNIAALKQDSMKRMLAYSSISHTGYAMIGLIAAGVGGQSLVGASSTMFYIFAYTIMTLGTFGFVCLFEKKEDTLLRVDQLKGLARSNPWTALCMTILLLSLAGIPPAIGFFGKFYIFAAAVNEGLIWLAIWGVINSVISVYYYLRPVVYMYMSEEQGSPVLNTKSLTHFSFTIMATLVVFIGVVSEPFYRFVTKSVAGLF